MNKWIFFYKALSVPELLRLLLKRYGGSFGKDRADRSFVLYQFLERCFKENLPVKSDGDALLFKQFVNGVQVRFSLRKFTSDPWVYAQIITQEEHSFIRKEIERRKLPMDYMIDAGANIGLTTLYFKSCFPGLQIAAIEPDAGNLAQCKKNISLNRFSSVEFIPKALWYKAASLEKELTTETELEWGYQFKESGSASQPQVLYDAITIEDCMKELGWPRIDYLKIDIEGAEQFLFASAEYCLFLHHTTVISIEAHTKPTEEMIRQLLQHFGFDVFKSGELVIGIKSV